MAALPATAKRKLSDLRVHYISLVQAALLGGFGLLGVYNAYRDLGEPPMDQRCGDRGVAAGHERGE